MSQAGPQMGAACVWHSEVIRTPGAVAMQKLNIHLLSDTRTHPFGVLSVHRA